MIDTKIFCDSIKVRFSVINWTIWPLKENKFIRKSKSEFFCFKIPNAGENLTPLKEEEEVVTVSNRSCKLTLCYINKKKTLNERKLGGAIFYSKKTKKLTINIAGIPSFVQITPCVHLVCEVLNLPKPEQTGVRIDSTTFSGQIPKSQIPWCAERMDNYFDIESFTSVMLKESNECEWINVVPNLRYSFSGQTIRFAGASFIIFTSGAFVCLGAKTGMEMLYKCHHFLSLVQCHWNKVDEKTFSLILHDG